MGWRYLMFTLGGMNVFLWAIRFVAFRLYESPRYLAGRGKDAEAVDVLRKVAEFNGCTCPLTTEDLKKAAHAAAEMEKYPLVLSKSSQYSLEPVKALFATKKMAWSSGLLVVLWGVCKKKRSPRML
jgi:hypothetical protein